MGYFCRPLLWALALSSFASTPLLAQTTLAVPLAAIPNEDRADYTIRREVPEVQMPLTVTDTRQPSAEITPEALRVVDNGVPVTITSVAQPSTTPVDLTLLMDVSDSVSRDSEREYEAAASIAQSLRPQFDHLTIVAFSSKVDVVPDVSLADDIPSKLRALPRGHLSSVYDAIARTSDEVRQRPRDRRRVVVLFSDGEDTDSRIVSNEALKAALSSGAVFYAVTMPRDKYATPNRFLELLCSVTSGHVIAITRKADPTRSVQQLETAMATQYIVSFRPAATTSRFGAWHTVSVVSQIQGVEVRSRAGYLAQ